jgi:hypothetical protein
VLLTASGVDGDTICDVAHHGGPDQAVYAYSTDDLAWWSAELARPGCYLAVESAGEVRAGDPVTVLSRPAHGVTVLDLMDAMTGERTVLPRVRRAEPDLGVRGLQWLARVGSPRSATPGLTRAGRVRRRSLRSPSQRPGFCGVLGGEHVGGEVGVDDSAGHVAEPQVVVARIAP